MAQKVGNIIAITSLQLSRNMVEGYIQLSFVFVFETSYFHQKLRASCQKALGENTQEVENQGLPAVLVVSPGIRPWLSKIIRHRLADLTVLSYSEIPEDQAVKVVATVSIDEEN